MAIDLKAVEQLATDQSSLKAAAGLAKPAKWSGIGGSPDGALIWGECAGSGANPYRVMADLRDLGNKCTCPSRKFPCKHVLGLLWLNAEAVVPFAPADTPAWVSDWLGRRRGTSPAKPANAVTPPGEKDLRAARAVEPETVEDPKDVARREAQAARRNEETERAIFDALDALEQWVGDQLRLGLSGFIDDATARCRRIAARLVDGKAAVLAGRIDELPSRLLALAAADRPRGAVVELGKLVLLARAFRATPRDAEIRRAVATSETRETVLADPQAPRVNGHWEVLAEQVQTRRDGLVSQTTWLLNLAASGPRFAMLLDFFPASAGRRGSVFTPGERFQGELVFYPSQQPLRALLVRRDAAEDILAPEWPAPDAALSHALTRPLLAEPWTIEIPLLLPQGRIAHDDSGGNWWQAADGTTSLPVAGNTEGLLAGTKLTRTAAIWSGNRLTILAAQSPWGRIGGHD
ncbi:SWIM zinc finger family protein [Bradyrhizobium manausense]|uniref:SWIM zinc finger family protein n=1 Tax=Bradyrhizobium manausense TaxID=989370 RepID=UPI001BA5F65B|nr:SWIM zinc finger family protein [Bradyrhizobium manausense]MBR1086812.1 SWIM zinc finger family protein [Bradyrhizobium manausense]